MIGIAELKVNWTILRLPVLTERKGKKFTKYSDSEMPGCFLDPKNVAHSNISEICNTDS